MKNLKIIIVSLLVILILAVAVIVFIGKNQPKNNDLIDSTESSLPCGKAGETLGGEIDHCCPGLEPSPLSKGSFGGLFECK